MSNRCDQEVYDNGTQVFLTHTLAAKDVEDWVQQIAKESNQKVDWHYGAGRAQVLALGDLEKVKEAIIKLRSIHDAAYIKAMRELACFEDFQSERVLKGIWQYNGFE